MDEDLVEFPPSRTSLGDGDSLAMHDGLDEYHGRRAKDTQIVYVSTILPKMAVDYPHFASVPVAEGMLNLLAEAHFIAKAEGRPIASDDGLGKARLEVSSIGASGLEVYVVGSSGRHPLSYEDGRIVAPSLPKDSSLVAEWKVLESANEALAKAVDRQIREIDEAVEFVSEYKVGLFGAVRSAALRKYEEMRGFRDQVGPWSISATLRDADLVVEGVRLELDVTARKGSEVVQRVGCRLEVHFGRDEFEEPEFDSFDVEEVRDRAEAAIDQFFGAERTHEHYHDLAERLRPTLLESNLKAATENLSIAKALAERLRAERQVMWTAVASKEATFEDRAEGRGQGGR